MIAVDIAVLSVAVSPGTGAMITLVESAVILADAPAASSCTNDAHRTMCTVLLHRVPGGESHL